jgi:hypothetical protein
MIEDSGTESEASKDITIAEPHGKLWQPIIGLSDKELAEWEQEGEFHVLRYKAHDTCSYRGSSTVASGVGGNNEVVGRI